MWACFNLSEKCVERTYLGYLTWLPFNTKCNKILVFISQVIIQLDTNGIDLTITLPYTIPVKFFRHRMQN